MIIRKKENGLVGLRQRLRKQDDNKEKGYTFEARILIRNDKVCSFDAVSACLRDLCVSPIRKFATKFAVASQF
jgi:hypothetical protein